MLPFIFITLTGFAQEDVVSKLPPEVRTDLEEVLNHSKAWFAARERAANEKALVAYREALLRLGRRITPDQQKQLEAASARDARCAVAALASRHAADPEKMEELLRYYGEAPPGDGPQPVVVRPRRLEARHTAEPYRPAWEALLLAPISPRIRFMGEGITITRALEALRHPASLPLLRLACGHARRGGTSNFTRELAEERQFRILEALNAYASSRALELMLECLAITEEGGEQSFGLKTFRQWVSWFLTDQHGYRNGPQWRAVLNSFPTADLSSADRELIRNAAAHYGK